MTPRILPVLACSWRDQEFIETFLNSLCMAAQNSELRIRLYILENGPGGQSSKEKRDSLANQINNTIEIVSVQTEKNIGIAGGMNLLYEHCIKDQNNGDPMCPHLFVTNTDIHLDIDFFSEYQKILSATQNDVLVCNVYYSKYGKKRTGTKKLSFYMRQEPTGLVPNQITQTFSGDGAMLGVPFTAAKQRTPPSIFDTEDVYTSEDVELFFWARSKNIKVVFVPKLELDHFGSGTFGTAVFRDRSLALQYAKVCSWRKIVRRYKQPKETIGYCLMELSFMYAFIKAYGPSGLLTYFDSFKINTDLLKADHTLDAAF